MCLGIDVRRALMATNGGRGAEWSVEQFLFARMEKIWRTVLDWVGREREGRGDKERVVCACCGEEIDCRW